MRTKKEIDANLVKVEANRGVGGIMSWQAWAVTGGSTKGDLCQRR